MSTSLKQLEEILGVMLVQRGSRFQGFTPEGERTLDWARRLHAVAQTGLAYPDTTGYDRDRYEHVRRIAAEMLAAKDPELAEAYAM